MDVAELSNKTCLACQTGYLKNPDRLFNFIVSVRMNWFKPVFTGMPDDYRR